MSNPLTKLIGKAAWKNVLESLTSDPQQATEPIPTTWSSSNVYPLHQAVSRSSSKPIPPCVLKALINCNPEALDYYAFLGACENKRAHIEVIETLFAEASMETLQTVQTHANDLTLAALGNDNNAEIIGLFCNKYPHLLKGDILYQACKNGTPNCVAAILQSAQKHKASIVGCLMDLSTRHDGTSSQGEEESPLEVSNRLFDRKNPERMATLAICVQYASASRAETGGSDPKNGYPLPVAAIGWVSPQICEDIILTERQQGNEAGRSAFVEKCAFKKAMHMVYEKPDFDQIPEVFQNQDLIKACKKKCPEEVYKILRKDKKTTTTRKVISRKHNGENALDVAIKVYKEKDEKSCDVLSICVKHINAIKMNLQECSTEPPYEYPTAFAAVGYVTKGVLHSIFSKFKHEIRTKLNGKLAIKKLLYLGLGGGDYCNYTNRLERKYMFSMEGKQKKTKQITWASMETISEYSGSSVA